MQKGILFHNFLQNFYHKKMHKEKPSVLQMVYMICIKITKKYSKISQLYFYHNTGKTKREMLYNLFCPNRQSGKHFSEIIRYFKKHSSGISKKEKPDCRNSAGQNRFVQPIKKTPKAAVVSRCHFGCFLVYIRYTLPRFRPRNALEHIPFTFGSYAPKRYWRRSVPPLFCFCRCLSPISGLRASLLPRTLYHGPGHAPAQWHTATEFC